MTGTKQKTSTHPTEWELADYLGKGLSAGERERLTDHIGSCPDCLARVTAAYEAVSEYGETRKSKKRRSGPMKRPSFYLIGAIIAFALSFLLPRFFLQFLVAALVLGMKWIADSRSTKMLIMIHEAWKKGGEKEASKILETLDPGPKKRF